MAFLVSDVLAEVRENLPAFYPDSDPNALKIVNKAQVDLMRMVDLYPYTDLVVPIVSGVGEYALSNVLRINAARYVTSASSSIPLRETSVDRLDTDYRGWRSYQATGQPYLFYRQAGNLGLYMAPNQTTLGGYPNVTLNVLTRHDFASLSDPLPDHIDKIDAYVLACCVHWCLRNDRESLPLYIPAADAAAKDLQSFERRVLVRQKDQIRADIPYPTNR